MMEKNYLIVGADTCIGYALCKRLMIEKEFCIYGINTKFLHYGKNSFQYVFNRNVYDEAELYANSECRAYLSEKKYEAVFWCDDVWSNEESSVIRGKVERFLQILGGIEYQEIIFWIDEARTAAWPAEEPPAERSRAVAIPNVYGIYQEREAAVVKIIMNDGVEEFRRSEKVEKFLSAWSIAEAIIDNCLMDLDRYTFSVPIKNLVLLLEDLKKDGIPDLRHCMELLRLDDERKTKKILYNLLEMIEFYESNEQYYSKRE